jgi:hypothetical protein
MTHGTSDFPRTWQRAVCLWSERVAIEVLGIGAGPATEPERTLSRFGVS